ncbi:MAG: hypothetical protein ACREPX_01675 [Rhodanobacteraceae bacterium]
MSRGASIARIKRYKLGNVHTDGAEVLARLVRKRALAERKVNRGVSLFIDRAGDVYAPSEGCVGAMLTRNSFPSWHIAAYMFSAPVPKSAGRRAVLLNMPTAETTPTVADIADDILFHVSPSEKKAA